MEPVVGQDPSTVSSAEMIDYRVCDQQPRIRAYECTEAMYHFLGYQKTAQHEDGVFRKGKADPAEDEEEEESNVWKMLCEM